ncbi:MAG: Hsp33 family molecular chaperone HslO [Lachnospiraceae bacterium]|nr:Hsp33 family molecular chaperone HslO [Lachnospiraceae bacterium]
MSDYIVRATAGDGMIRAFAATTRDLTEEARRIHDLSPVASAALGRTLTAGAMMGVMMKNDDDLLTIIFDGNGPIGGITVTADSHGNVKGYVKEPGVMLPPNAQGKLDVGGAVGQGILRIIRDTGLREPYVGEVAIRTGEIAEDLTAYFMESEQVPSVVALGVLMDREKNEVREAGGFMIQLMPDCPDELIDRLEEKMAGVSSVTAMLRDGMTPEAILTSILGDMDLEINETQATQFACNCSRSRVTKALIALGSEELKDMINDGKSVSLGCGFCGKQYEFTVEDLRVLLMAAQG